MMEIKQGKLKFYVGDSEEKPLGEITYYHEGDQTIVADHTFVDEALRGQKMARKLVERLVTFARDEHLKIVPVCPYVVRVLNETEAYHDVLKK